MKKKNFEAKGMEHRQQVRGRINVANRTRRRCLEMKRSSLLLATA